MGCQRRPSEIDRAAIRRVAQDEELQSSKTKMCSTPGSPRALAVLDVGWPDETLELKRDYPTDVLVTGFDIIFFWVAARRRRRCASWRRFRSATSTSMDLVRDEDQQDVEVERRAIDPLELIDAYGASTRSASRSPPWRRRAATSSSSTSRVEGHPQLRDQAAKRRALRRDQRRAGRGVRIQPPRSKPSTAGSPARRKRALASVYIGARAYRFNEAAGADHSFIWHKVLRLGTELIKLILVSSDQAAAAETRAMIAGGARPGAHTAPSLHVLRHRGAVGEACARRRGEGRYLLIQPLAEASGDLRTRTPTPKSAGVIRLISEAALGVLRDERSGRAAAPSSSPA